MNKKNIVNDVIKKIKLSAEDKEIIQEIEEAKREWENATRYFELVDDPAMVDYAIYLQQAARVRYMYLLKKAKEKDLSADYHDLLKTVGY